MSAATEFQHGRYQQRPKGNCCEQRRAGRIMRLPAAGYTVRRCRVRRRWRKAVSPLRSNLLRHAGKHCAQALRFGYRSGRGHTGLGRMVRAAGGSPGTRRACHWSKCLAPCRIAAAQHRAIRPRSSDSGCDDPVARRGRTGTASTFDRNVNRPYIDDVDRSEMQAIVGEISVGHRSLAHDGSDKSSPDAKRVRLDLVRCTVGAQIMERIARGLAQCDALARFASIVGQGCSPVEGRRVSRPYAHDVAQIATGMRRQIAERYLPDRRRGRRRHQQARYATGCHSNRTQSQLLF